MVQSPNSDEVCLLKPDGYTPARRLEAELSAKYALRVASIAGAPDSTFLDEGDREAEAQLIFVCQAAAEVIVKELERISKERPDDQVTMAIGWGRVCHWIAQQIPNVPSRGIAKTRGRLNVVPSVGMVGITGVTQPFEAMNNALLAAQALGGVQYSFPAPALVDSDSAEAFLSHVLIKETRELASNADLVVTPVATSDSQATNRLKESLLQPRDEADPRFRNAVGEINNFWFDKEGKALSIAGVTPTGLGPDDMRSICSRGGVVLAVVASSFARVEPLRAALNGGWVNGVVTDVATTEALLSEEDPSARSSRSE